MLSTGVIGPRLPMEKLLAGVDAAAAALSPGGGPDAAEAILTTDAGPKTAVAHRRRVHRRGHGEGRRDDPSLPRDDARGRDDGLPARPGRGGRVPAARRRAVVQPHLGRRRLLDERRGRAARERAVRDRPRFGDGRAVRRRAARASAPTWPGRSSRTAKARPSSSRSRSQALPRRRRRARSRSASPPPRS